MNDETEFKLHGILDKYAGGGLLQSWILTMKSEIMDLMDEESREAYTSGYSAGFISGRYSNDREED